MRLLLLSTFHFVVLFISICFIFRIVQGEKVREYTVAFQGSDEDAETIIEEEKPQSPPPPKQPHRVHIHPIHEAREFLGEHNKIRKELGEPLLKWDKKLAHYARRFAGKRAVNCDMIHSLGPYGENIYWGADYSKHTAAVAVRAWAGETNNYNPMKNTCDPLKSCGHYKQMVWKTSTKLGCARTKCNSGGVYIICSYDPPGNYVGESPFDTPESSETPSTPTSAHTKTPSTPTSAHTKTPSTPTSAQTKTPSTPTSAQKKTPTPTSAQTKTPSTPTSVHTKTPSTPTSAQTKTPTPTSAQTKTPSTPTSAQKKTPTSTQTKTPSTPTSAQTKTPTPTSAKTKTPTPTSAKTKTPTPVQRPTTPGGAKTKPTSPSTPS